MLRQPYGGFRDDPSDGSKTLGLLIYLIDQRVLGDDLSDRSKLIDGYDLSDRSKSLLEMIYLIDQRLWDPTSSDDVAL